MNKKTHNSIYLLLVSIVFLGCNRSPSNIDDQSDFINFGRLPFSETIKLIMCDCYGAYGYFTKTQLVDYAKNSDIIDLSIITNLEALDYEILIYNDSLILGDSLRLESSFSGFLSSGLKINTSNCSFENTVYKKAFFDKEIVTKSTKKLTSVVKEDFYHEVSDQLKLYERNVILDNKRLTFFPRKGERIKTSIIQLDLIDDNKWIVSNIVQNHSLKVLGQINNRLFSFIDTSRIVRDFGIERFFVPIKMYEKYQLEENVD